MSIIGVLGVRAVSRRGRLAFEIFYGLRFAYPCPHEHIVPHKLSKESLYSHFWPSVISGSLRNGEIIIPRMKNTNDLWGMLDNKKQNFRLLLGSLDQRATTALN